MVPAAIGARNGPQSWNRDELFASGALTLGELLEQVPGVTHMTAGFIIAPATLAWHGDPGGVRVFVDGVEREEVTIRNGGVTDFSLVPLSSLEFVSLEETAGELRVHARTWRVDRTTASTRTDVLTGSENLNLFRGFFGKRASNGIAVQLGAQQVSTLSVPGMDGQALGAFARLGWAAGSWSVDATMLRQGLDRSVGARYLTPGSPEPANGTALPAFNGSTSTSYLRLAWKSPDAAGPWAQLVGATLGSGLRHGTTGTSSSAATTDTAASGDTTASETQYMAQAGINRGRLRLNGELRLRSLDGTGSTAPLVRAEYADARYALSASAGTRFGGASVWDVRAQASPFEWLRLSASDGVSQPSAGGRTRAGSSVAASIRVRDRWIGAGAIRVDGGAVLAPVELDTVVRTVGSPAGKALVVSAGGPLWRGWQFQTDAVEWDAAAPFRPQTQANTRVSFSSDFHDRFPRSNFHLLAALTDEFRSRLYVPTAADPVGQAAKGFNVLGTLLEIRISTAVISWSYRDMTGSYYETFPGYLMPRITSVYGIRWEFWN